MNRKFFKESDNSYIDDSKKATNPTAAAEKVVYDVYTTLRGLNPEFDIIDEVRSQYEKLSDLIKSKSEVAAYEDFKSVASDLKGVADYVEDLGDDYDEESEALRYAATLLTEGKVDESKKREVIGRVSMREAKKALKESRDPRQLAVIEATTLLDAYGYDNASAWSDDYPYQVFLPLEEDPSIGLNDDYSFFKKAVAKAADKYNVEYDIQIKDHGVLATFEFEER